METNVEMPNSLEGHERKDLQIEETSPSEGRATSSLFGCPEASMWGTLAGPVGRAASPTARTVAIYDAHSRRCVGIGTVSCAEEGLFPALTGLETSDLETTAAL